MFQDLEILTVEQVKEQLDILGWEYDNDSSYLPPVPQWTSGPVRVTESRRWAYQPKRNERVITWDSDEKVYRVVRVTSSKLDMIGEFNVRGDFGSYTCRLLNFLPTK